MSSAVAAVQCKARAFVDGLTRLPRSARAAVPHGHFARDYNTLRKLVLEVAPSLDERLLGKFISVYQKSGAEYSQASYVEIEVYARQIVEQLALILNSPASPTPVLTVPVAADPNPAKTYDVAIIRQKHQQAYARWSDEGDEYLRSRCLEGAAIDDLASELERQPSAIRSRLRKLGIDVQRDLRRLVTQKSPAQTDAEAGGET